MQENVVLTNKNNDYRGYSLFKDVKNPVIRAWNRLNTIYNIKEQHGSVLARRYAEQLGKSELISVYLLIASVDSKGYEQTRRDVFRYEVQ